MKKLSLIAVSFMLAVSGCDKLQSLQQPAQPEPAAGIYVDQGYKQLSLQKPEEAIASFDKALKADDKNARAYQGKGLALNNLGMHSEADKQYGKAVEIDVTSVPIRNNFAMSKILQGKYQEALDMLTPIARTHPDNATVQENLALANCMLGKREEARQLYSKNLTPAEVEDNLRFCRQYEKMRTGAAPKSRPKKPASPEDIKNVLMPSETSAEATPAPVVQPAPPAPKVEETPKTETAPKKQEWQKDAVRD